MLSAAGPRSKPLLDGYLQRHGVHAAMRHLGIADVDIHESAPAVKELGVGINVLPHASRRFAVHVRQLKAVPMQMHGMRVVGLIVERQTIALALVQHLWFGFLVVDLAVATVVLAALHVVLGGNEAADG